MKPAARAPALARLGAWVAGLDPESLHASTRLAARYEILDMISAVHAAAATPACRQIEAGLRATAGAGGRATVVASGSSLPPVEAAQVNAAYAIAQDFDSIVWMGHTCHSAVFASLAVAEHERATGTELVAAVVVANEVAGRIGASSFFGPLNGQMWSFIHLVGAAAATAKLLHLDAERTAHALAISLAQPNFVLPPGFFGPMSKLLTASTPTGAGIRAAYLAREGVTGPLDVLEDPRGFWHRFAFVPMPAMLEGLGELWVTETLAMKTTPGCFYFETACTAVAELLRRHPALAPDDVARVLVETTKLSTEVTRLAAEYATPGLSAIKVNFDLALTVAVMLHARRLTSRELDAGWLAENEREILRWRECIQVTHDPSLTLRLLSSASGVPGERKALAQLRLSDFERLVTQYRAEYGSSLLTVKEAAGWVRALLRRAPAPPGAADHVRRSPSTVPLYFPNRVTIELADGKKDTARVDLPVGSFAAPGVERELRAMFLRECSPALGVEGAEAALSAGLELESRPPGEFARLCTSRGGHAVAVPGSLSRSHR
jgi:2-methylcitrate dehydratase PrpD